jgi:hypothetical protein
MALTTYTELKAAVADWLNRDDLTSQIADFIVLGEQEIRRRLNRRLLTVSVTLDAASLALPSDVDEIVTLSLDTASFKGPLDLTTAAGVRDLLERYSATGLPRAYFVGDRTLYLAPVPDTSYAGLLIYREALTPLSGSVASNPTLARSPDIYLYAALRAAAPFLEHDARLQLWETMLDRAIFDENIKRENEELAAAPIRPRLPVVFGD